MIGAPVAGVSTIRTLWGRIVEGCTHVCRVDVALDDVEDGDVACSLARRGRHHAILGLE